MARDLARPRRDDLARRSRAAAEQAPARPTRLQLWLRRRRGLLRPAGLGLLGAGLLGATALAVVAADPYGRLAALWDGAAEIAGGAGLTVQEVMLEGSRNTPLELVREAIGVRRGDPILSFSPQEAKERLEEIPWIGRAHVERHLPGSIRVVIEERRPYAIWQNEGRFSVIDREGKVVTGENIGAFGRLPLVVGAGPKDPNGLVRPPAAAPLVDLLQSTPALMERVHAVVRVGDRRWNLKLRNNTDVLLPEGHEAAALARLVELHAKQGLLERPLAAIDLRQPDKLVLRVPQQAQPAQPETPPMLQRVRSGR
jgi:cell division protein FtsQ